MAKTGSSNKKNKLGALDYITAAAGIAGTIGGALNSDINYGYVNSIDNTIQDNLLNFNNIDTSSADAFERSSLSFGDHLGYTTKRDVMGMSGIENVGNIFLNSALGAGVGSATGPWGALAGGIVGLGTGMVGGITRSRKASSQAQRLNDSIFEYNKLMDSTLANKAAETNMNILNKLMYNLSAYGGPLTMRYTGTMSPFGNTLADGGNIHIKPSKRGTFTAAAKKHGKSVQSFASQVLANKENYSPAMVKKANFARNAAKWHSFGGDLNTNGGDFSNGLIMIGNGGTHEENPMEGVQMGMDAQGVPNLVEEGEVIFNDYVFSDRLTVPNAVKEKYKLRGNKKLTFADAAKQVQKESEERPNDPISKRGLMSSMSRLLQAQEVVRQQNQVNQGGAQYAHGGRMGNLFDSGGPKDDALDFYNNYLSNTYGKNPYTINTGTAHSPDYVPKFTTVPDDNELLDIARVEAGEEPKGKVTPTLLPLIDYYSNSDKDSNNYNRHNLSLLRYAPVVGDAIGLEQNIFNKPNYSSSDTILNEANKIGEYTPIEFTFLNNYLTYKPFDRNSYTNKLSAQSGATRRAIVNQSAGNRATALAGLLAADYNAQGELGDLIRQADEYNQAQKERVATFNRGTDQFNSEMGLKAAVANQEAALKAKSLRLSGIAQAMQMRDAEDARRGASMSANLTNFFNSLGDIGREEYSRNMIMNNPALYYSIDRNGNISYKNGYENLSEAEKQEVRRAANKDSQKKAKGGYLTIKKGGNR